MRDSSLRWVLVLLLAVCVPFQATLALSAGQHAALEQCHDGGHAQDSGSHCGACCGSAAMVTLVVAWPSGPGALDLLPHLPPSSALLRTLDRPPLAV
jgi:hypothetical protein